MRACGPQALASHRTWELTLHSDAGIPPAMAASWALNTALTSALAMRTGY